LVRLRLVVLDLVVASAGRLIVADRPMHELATPSLVCHSLQHVGGDSQRRAAVLPRLGVVLNMTQCWGAFISLSDTRTS